MNKYIKFTASLLSGIIFSVFLSFPAHAVYFGSGTNMTLEKSQPLDETVFVAGETLTIDSDINGDLFCVGQNIIVNGNIKGDVLCAGQKIKVNGTVDGNVRVAGQDIEINGTVARNVNVVAQNLTLAKYSSIKGDIIFGVQLVDLRGSLGRDLAGGGEQVSINGSLLRNATITASNINISDTASISGTLDYYMDETGSFVQSQLQNIKGPVTRHEITKPETTKDQAREVSTATNIFGKIISIISYTLLSFLLIYFTPKKTKKIMELIKESPLKTFFLGLGISIISPFVFLLLFASIIGASSAFVLLPLYIITMIVGSLYHSIMVGKFISTKLPFIKSKSDYLYALIGCVVVGVFISVPVLGWFAGLCLYLSGLGATVLSYLPEKK